MILYVVRHGETEWNRLHKVQGRTDIPLNDYGRHLARETAEGMKSLSLDLEPSFKGQRNSRNYS